MVFKMDITKYFPGELGDSQTDAVYEFNEAMKCAKRKENFLAKYNEARRGRNDGHRTARRIVWKKDLQGRLVQRYEEGEEYI